MIDKNDLIIGEKYNWEDQEERLVYIGQKGSWYQFALVEKPFTVWCEVLEDSLELFVKTQ